MAALVYKQEQNRETNTPIKISLYVYVVVLNVTFYWIVHFPILIQIGH